MSETTVPCINGCIKCGFCCVAMTIEDKKLKKPAFTRCRHLIYVKNEAVCEIHGKNKPQTCVDYNPIKRFNMLWFDDRLKYYKQNEYMLHLKWMARHGYLDHLPIFAAIRNFDSSRLPDIYKYFLRPYLIASPRTLAADNNWLKYWPGLLSYLKKLKLEQPDFFCKILEKSAFRLKMNETTHQQRFNQIISL